MTGIVNVTPAEGRFYRIDAAAAGLNVAAIEREMRRLGRPVGWPIIASTAVHALRLDAAQVADACRRADARIEAGRESLIAPIVEAERLAGERAAEARRKAEREAEDRIAIKRAAAQGLAPEAAQ
ncbi:hypothetical protein ABB55_03235 [Prosthecomicrobium hirschii]|uniref:Uncharacterized protein n=1 Tax=Prosthecodimorpha hirschii TaxID=665126 RepID=A0A0P6VZW2_9HYPH|nr:hypothetical protein [Prosthecomicrobium hirschii]KPL51360.1 hypothetical protein ABB55_03235 [Prosthecomicrobium hirschii]